MKGKPIFSHLRNVNLKARTNLQRQIASTALTQDTTVKRLSFPRRAFKIVTYSYGALALIPTSFTAASLWSLIVLHDKPKARAYALWAWTGWLSLPLSVILFGVAPFSLLFDPVDRKAMDFIQRLWARLTIWPFFKVKVENGNIPLDLLEKEGRGCIVVSNHRSMLDVFAILASLDVPVRFVSKMEIFFIPLVGWVMGLIGHVSLTRGDKTSGKTVLENCKYFLNNGRVWSVVFFAEGSRTKWEDQTKLNDFKIGAFRLAESTKSPILPICVLDSGQVMPPGKEFNYLKADSTITIRIQQPILVKNENASADSLRASCFESIQNGLKQEGS